MPSRQQQTQRTFLDRPALPQPSTPLPRHSSERRRANPQPPRHTLYTLPRTLLYTLQNAESPCKQALVTLVHTCCTQKSPPPGEETFGGPDRHMRQKSTVIYTYLRLSTVATGWAPNTSVSRVLRGFQGLSGDNFQPGPASCPSVPPPLSLGPHKIQQASTSFHKLPQDKHFSDRHPPPSTPKPSTTPVALPVAPLLHPKTQDFLANMPMLHCSTLNPPGGGREHLFPLRFSAPLRDLCVKIQPASGPIRTIPHQSGQIRTTNLDASSFPLSAFQRFSEANELAFLVLFCSQLLSTNPSISKVFKAFQRKPR